MAIAALYAEDAVFVPAEDTPKGARASIESYYRKLFDGPGIAAFVPREFRSTDQDAFETGDYTLYAQFSGSAPSVASGTYERVYEKTDDGSWRIAANVLQRPSPAPSPIWTWPDFNLRFIQGGLTAVVALLSALIAYRLGLASGG
jgi:ketosteroid isomerase-like protein